VIRGQVQACLNERMIKRAVLLATGHEGEASQVSQHGSGPILPVESKQAVRLWELVCSQVPTNSRETPAQFLPVAPVAFVPKTAEPLKAVSLADDGSRPYHLPTLASHVARGADLIQSAKGWGQIVSLRQGALASGFARLINIKDDPLTTHSIQQASRLLVVRERANEQIIQKERAQRFDGGFRNLR
jgi:hypothetical protein